MTVMTQPKQVFHRIVLSVVVYMMDGQDPPVPRAAPRAGQDCSVSKQSLAIGRTATFPAGMSLPNQSRRFCRLPDISY